MGHCTSRAKASRSASRAAALEPALLQILLLVAQWRRVGRVAVGGQIGQEACDLRHARVDGRKLSLKRAVLAIEGLLTNYPMDSGSLMCLRNCHASSDTKFVEC